MVWELLDERLHAQAREAKKLFCYLGIPLNRIRCNLPPLSHSPNPSHSFTPHFQHQVESSRASDHGLSIFIKLHRRGRSHRGSFPSASGPQHCYHSYLRTHQAVDEKAHDHNLNNLAFRSYTCQEIPPRNSERNSDGQPDMAEESFGSSLGHPTHIRHNPTGRVCTLHRNSQGLSGLCGGLWGGPHR